MTFSSDDFHHAVTPGDLGSHARQLAACRSSKQPFGQWDDDHMSPSPFFVPPARVSELMALFDALHPALVGIVRAWWSKPDWHALIPLSPKMATVLSAIDQARPFEHIGSIRPDYIIPPRPEDPLRICEINARFIFNGFWHIVFHDDIMEECGFYGEMKRTSISGNELMKVFHEMADPSKPVAIVAGSEVTHPSWKFGMEPYLWAHRNAFVVDPKRLSVAPDGSLTDGKTTITQALLQLHQHELEELREDVLIALGKVCFNDLRTIYIIHDKRLLGLIRQEFKWLVSSGILNPHQVDILDRGLAETHIVTTARAPKAKDGWALKKFGSGKGDGMLIGSDASQVQWDDALAAGTHVLQRFYPSKIADLTVLEGGRATSVCWYVVGTLMVINRHLVGLTCFRASGSKITAISSGGISIAGATTSDIPSSLTLQKSAKYLAIPASARISVPQSLDISPEYVQSIRTSLASNGLALLSLPKDSDPNSAHMIALAYSLGQPLVHSSTHGVLWDVTPSSASSARSHTTAIFPWHTDCSFEAAPPRYFALHVLRPDWFQGGKLRVFPVETLLSSLSTDVVHTLRSPHFTFSVPPEFHKGSPTLVGSVLAGDRMRWRRDILSGTTGDAQSALEEVEGLLASEDGLILAPDDFAADTILLLDNGRWLHARSEVRDPVRLLRRVRWGPEQFPTI